MVKVDAKQKGITRARKDIVLLLDRYGLTLPEVLGISRPRRDPDDEAWRVMKKEYEEVQTEMFKERYPRLWRKAKKQ